MQIIAGREALQRNRNDLLMQFHILSFEGPDGYARAGGIASRITGLSEALAEAGFETHLWFVGDPHLPGHESRGQLALHRWCQWISHYHPAGVYDGEEGKRADYAASLPPFLLREVLLPHLQRGGRAVVLAEEWHTVDTVLHLDWLLRNAQVRDKVTIFWNANNIFSFDRIAWDRLAAAAVITTVSRFMKYQLWGRGVNPLVIPNGLTADAFVPPDREALALLRSRLHNRTLLSKVARWDPDKRWLLTIETVRVLKNLGWRPLLIARGGVEEHGAEVLAKAAAAGLRVPSEAVLSSVSKACCRPWKKLTKRTSCTCARRSTRRVAACSTAAPLLFSPTAAANRLASWDWKPWRLVGWRVRDQQEKTMWFLGKTPWCWRPPIHGSLSCCFGNCVLTQCVIEPCDGPGERRPSSILGQTLLGACFCRACVS